MSQTHIPVLLNSVLDYASPQKGETVIDCTFGRGGYSRAFLEKGCRVHAFDRDPSALEEAQRLTQDFPEYFTFTVTKFSKISDICPPDSADIILFDIGVSSPQLDEAHRGFSFNKEGALDMRMGESSLTAADLVNGLSEKELADIIYNYGEDHHARKHARKICERRKIQPFTTTTDLAGFIASYIHVPFKQKRKIHPATLVFQALRIAVNDELREFETALLPCEHILKENGRLITVTFHSLEDRIAKNYCKEKSFTPKISKYAPKEEKPKNLYHLLTKKPVIATAEELQSNPRASSAKLRAVQRTGFGKA